MTDKKYNNITDVSTNNLYKMLNDVRYQDSDSQTMMIITIVRIIIKLWIVILVTLLISMAIQAFFFAFAATFTEMPKII